MITDRFGNDPWEGWIANKTGEHILFSKHGWFIVMQCENDKWYYSHAGQACGFWDTRKEAEDAAYAHRLTLD